jgi:hypothetical protein
MGFDIDKAVELIQQVAKTPVGWDKNAAIAYLDVHAEDDSTGRCASYTRAAIEAGGVTLTPVADAKDYGPSLTAVGFVALPYCPVEFEAGDVVIFNQVQDHPHGHMAMYDGTQWVSDWAQAHFAPGSKYRQHMDYVIYRYGHKPITPW